MSIMTLSGPPSRARDVIVKLDATVLPISVVMETGYRPRGGGGGSGGGRKENL